MKGSARYAWRAILFVFVWMYCGFLEREGHAQQQTSYTSFENYTVQDGLPSNRVHALLQDKKGFIWIGTEQRLVRFDGYNFASHPFGVSDSLESTIHNVGELFEDSSGSIWAGSIDGLFKLDPVTHQVDHFQFDSLDTSSLSHNNIFAIAQHSLETIWVGTQEGLNRIELSSGKVKRYKNNPDDPSSICGDLVTSLVFDQEETLWVGTRSGLCSYNQKTDSFRFWKNTTPSTESGDSDFIRSFHLDDANILWIGTQNGLFAFAVQRKSYIKVDTPFLRESDTVDPIISITSSSSKERLFGTGGGELWSYNTTSKEWKEINFYKGIELPPSSSPEPIYNLLIDDSGLLWMSLWGQGIFKQGVKKEFRSYMFNPAQDGAFLSYPEVSAIERSHMFKNVMWIGTNGGGLNVLDIDSGNITSFQANSKIPSSLISNKVLAIEESSKGVLWLGTDSGLDYVKLLDDKINPLGDFERGLTRLYIHSIVEDKYNNLWIGGEKDLLAIRDISKDLEVDSIGSIEPVSSEYTVWPLMESKYSDTLWVGTYGGGLGSLQLTKESNLEVLSTSFPSLSQKYRSILTIHEGRDGIVWVGTLGQGLLRLDSRTQSVDEFTVRNDLPHNSVSCIQSDEDENLWIGTYDGMAFLDRKDNTIYRFSEHDGLPDSYFVENACSADGKGSLYFGTLNGVVSFNPSQILIDKRSPSVVITGVDLFQEPLASDTSYTHKKVVQLKYDENFIRVHFSGLHYNTPNENVYAYKMEGVDREWVRAASTQRFANYTNLTPGSYVFQVKASNSDGVWNDQGTSLSFVIDRPYWQTWWFISLSTVFLFLIALSAHRYRVYHLLKVEHTRQQISRDLHDDIGGSLTSIALFMDILVRNRKVDKTFVKRLKFMAMTARQLVEDLRDTVWVVNAEYDTLQALVERMEQLADSSSSEVVVKCKVVSDIPEIPVKMETRRHILLIYKEALHNAQKHSEASKIEILVRCENEQFAFNVKDNGIGFDQSTVNMGNGLKNFRDRANEMKAKLKIESKIGQGTLVGLSIKLADIRDGISWS